MEEQAFRGLLGHVRSIDLARLHVTQQQSETQPPEAARQEQVAELIDRSVRAAVAAASPGREQGGPPTWVQVDGGPSYRLTDSGIAVVSMVGAMTKYGSSLSAMRYGTVGLRKTLRVAGRSEAVKGLLLVIDSPGGSISGTMDLADELGSIDKPTTAYIEDLGASAAYWVAAQADRVAANPSADVGSIGVYMVIDDWSGFYAAQGVKTLVIKSGPSKGAGVIGSEITAEQRNDFQRVIDETNDLFVNAVAKGRGLTAERAAELADGRIHVGENALKLGLVDVIDTYDAALAEVADRANPSRTRKQTSRAQAPEPRVEDSDLAASDKEHDTMPKNDTIAEGADTSAQQPSPPPENTDAKPQASAEQPKAATIAELKAGCPGADSDFLVKQLEAGATLDQAKDAWMKEQQTRLDATQQKLKDAEAQAPTAPGNSSGKRPGVQPVRTTGNREGTASGGDAIKAWQDAIDEQVKAGKTVSQATAHVARTQPELRQAYLEAYNADHGRPYEAA
jgi:signal peptide peptidase SppA